jgi:hypothetical protein
VFIAGWYMNLFLMGLNLFLSGMIFQRVFSEKLIYAYLSVIVICLSTSALRIHAMIGADASYLTLTLAFLLAVDDYIRRNSRRAFFVMVLLSALAPIHRYVGLALMVTGLLVILIEHRWDVRWMLRDGFFLGFFSILPIFWWLVIHNIIGHGSLWGPTAGQVVDVIQNLNLALTKMLHWFVPYFDPIMPVLTRPLIVIGVLVLILVILDWMTSGNWRPWWNSVMERSAYPSLLHGLVYFSAVALSINTLDHRYLLDDRYYVIVQLPTLMTLFLTYDFLIKSHIKLTARQSSYLLVFCFALWCIYPLNDMRKHLVYSLTWGEPSDYNIYNTAEYHEKKVVDEIQKLRADHPDALLYSNLTDAVWFFTRKPTRLLPNRNVPDISAAYRNWPGDEPGYIVWFNIDSHKHYLSPEELGQLASLELIYSDDSGEIYYVHSR